MTKDEFFEQMPVLMYDMFAKWLSRGTQESDPIALAVAFGIGASILPFLPEETHAKERASHLEIMDSLVKGLFNKDHYLEKDEQP